MERSKDQPVTRARYALTPGMKAAYGSGGGSIPHSALFEAFPEIWTLAASGTLRMDTEPVALANVEHVWQRQDLAGRRVVIIP
jgi:hypothetical protein